jgi:hypothetical protein
MGSSIYAEMQRANIRDNTDCDDTSACSITEGDLGRLLNDCWFDAPAFPPYTACDEVDGRLVNTFTTKDETRDSPSFPIGLNNSGGNDFHCHESWIRPVVNDFSAHSVGNSGDFINFERHNVRPNALFERPQPDLNTMHISAAGKAFAHASSSTVEQPSIATQDLTIFDQLSHQGQVTMMMDLANQKSVPTNRVSVLNKNHLHSISKMTNLPLSTMDVSPLDLSKLNSIGNPSLGSTELYGVTNSESIVKPKVSSLRATTLPAPNLVKDPVNAVVPQQLLSSSKIPTVSTFQELSNEVAYERKKSRAKNARLMINESIDKISVAMSAAGTQSKERYDQLVQIEQEKQSRIAPHVVSQKVSGPPKYGLSHAKSVIMDCASIADGAKKWDRPRFLESSAMMVQAMNSQCEVLMRELISCHEQISKMNTYMRQLQTNSLPRVIETSLTGQSQKPHTNVSKDTFLESEETMNRPKRARVAFSISSSPNASYTVTKEVLCAAVMAERKVMNRIMQFLDTPTKAKCLLRISKSWKRGDCFDIDQLWCDMCSTRLNPSNTGTEMNSNDTLTNVPSISSSETLFWRMYTAKVMPRFFKSSNMVYLGEGQIAGKALGWTFLVEPSNGETTRSVRSPPSPLLKGLNLGSDETTFLPVIKLWTIVQNVAIAYDEPIIIRDQIVTVDASTRRRTDEMKEIYWDVSYKKRLLNLQGNTKESTELSGTFVSSDTFTSCVKCGNKELCHLKLFDAVIIETNIYAKGCPTTSKFLQKSNYIQLLIQVPTMTTMPLVIRFDKDATSVASQPVDINDSFATSKSGIC